MFTSFFKKVLSQNKKKVDDKIKLNATKVMPVKEDSKAIITTHKKVSEILTEKATSNPLAETIKIVWEYPTPSLLSKDQEKKAERGDVPKTASTIEKTLQSFGIDSRVAEANLGAAVTQYALELAHGTNISQITSRADDLALATEAPTGQIRIEAPIPGRNLVGLEIPNHSLEVVNLRTLLTSSAMQKAHSKLVVALGLDVAGKPIAVDIAKFPHVFITGAHDSGKTVLINSFISSLLFRASPQEVRLILIDPKRLEITSYNGIPHLLTPVIFEPSKILSALKWAMAEMDKRYKLFAERDVKNIESYNQLSGFQEIPYIVIFVDELADIMTFAKIEIEDAIINLARKGNVAGIHLILASNSPISEKIKENIPCRIAFKVTNVHKSEEILNQAGAERLLGHGDMLYLPSDQTKPTRIQGAFISDYDIKKLVEYLKSQNYPVEYTEKVIKQPSH